MGWVILDPPGWFFLILNSPFGLSQYTKNILFSLVPSWEKDWGSTVLEALSIGKLMVPTHPWYPHCVIRNKTNTKS